MTYLIATIPIEKILQNADRIPSPLIIQRFARKPVMLSVLPNDVHSIYMCYEQPIYAYVMTDNWFQKHLPNLHVTHDTGVLNELPKLMENYESNKSQIHQIYPMERLVAFPQEILHKKIQQFGKSHSFKQVDCYGFVLKNFDIQAI